MPFLLDKDLKFPKDNFKSMKYMPYEMKPSFSMKRVRQWYEHWDGMIYISFSGGLDSSILAHVVCSAYEKYGLKGKIPLVCVDTRTEFPEIRGFTKEYVKWLQHQFPRLDIELVTIYPKHNFKWVIENKGFPIISKDTAGKIRKLRYGNLGDRHRNYLLNGDERGKFGMLSKKWQCKAYPEITKYDISDQCCEIMKKEPFRRYVREHKRYPCIGITQDEGFRRENQYNHTGCNVYDGTTIKSQPIAFWVRQDVLQYKMEYQIPICSVYGDVIRNRQGIYLTTKEQRTGCILCGFGCHLEVEPNRIQRLSESHPSIYHWGMQLRNHGITYQAALEDCGIPCETWESLGQMRLEQFIS